MILHFLCIYDGTFGINSDLIPLKRRKKHRTDETRFGPDFITYVFTKLYDIDELKELVVFHHLVEQDHKIFEDAMNSFNVSFWKDTISSKLESINYYRT